MDMFIKIGDLKGESRDKVHKESIDVLSWSWGLSNSGSAHMGGGAGSGKVHVQDLSFTKYIDASSNALIDACCTGKHFKQATLIMRKAGGSPLEYVVITLDEVMIGAVSTGGSGSEDRLTESVTLHFAKFKFSYQPQKADGSKDGGTRDVAYNIAENSKEG